MQINPQYFPAALEICKLRAKNFDIALSNLSLGFFNQVHLNKALDNKLSLMFKSLISYDFLTQISQGKTLFVGEGNLSFSASITANITNTNNIIASTYETAKELSDMAAENADFLRKLGVIVLHGIDATQLKHIFENLLFDTIIFQFPHTGSREAINGLNPNYVLVKEFLESASKQITKTGSILITTVDNDFYNNIFQFDDLSELVGLKHPTKYKFDPEEYKGYEHTMTHQDGSAIDKYSKFATWKFQL